MNLQFGGGSRVISASSFWIRFAEVVSCFALKDFESRSLDLEAAEDDPVEAGADPEVGALPEVGPLPDVEDEAFTDAMFCFVLFCFAVVVEDFFFGRCSNDRCSYLDLVASFDER